MPGTSVPRPDPGRGPEQQPRGARVVDGVGQVMKPAEVDVPRRHGEPVPLVQIAGEIGEAVPVPGRGLEVVEDRWTSALRS